MKTKVVLLFDDLRARPEALQYAVEFAVRMDSILVLMILLCLEPSGGEDESLEDSVESAITPHLQAARSAGLAVEVELRLGDQYSELMKYLAETRTIQSMVWGGEQEELQRRSGRGRPHWLARIREAIDFPVVVPVLRS